MFKETMGSLSQLKKTGREGEGRQEGRPTCLSNFTVTGENDIGCMSQCN